jgi:hypothetical protein
LIETVRTVGHNAGMTLLSDELTHLVAQLPPDKGEAVLQFARFLSEQAGDNSWEHPLAAAAKSQRVSQELADVDREIAQGKATPLSTDDL